MCLYHSSQSSVTQDEPLLHLLGDPAPTLMVLVGVCQRGLPPPPTSTCTEPMSWLVSSQVYVSLEETSDAALMNNTSNIHDVCRRPPPPHIIGVRSYHPPAPPASLHNHSCSLSSPLRRMLVYLSARPDRPRTKMVSVVVFTWVGGGGVE